MLYWTTKTEIRAIGFLYVTLELNGYQMGSMNRSLDL